VFATTGAADKITPHAKAHIGGNQLIGLCSLRTAAGSGQAVARRRGFHEKKPRLGDKARRQRSSRGRKDMLPYVCAVFCAASICFFTGSKAAVNTAVVNWAM